jgi:hypothetical protein
MSTGCSANFDPIPNGPLSQETNQTLGTGAPVHTTPLILKPGQSGRVGLLKVTFLRVLADSRCPADVICVWQGNAAIQLSVMRLGQPRTARRVVLNTGLEPFQAFVHEYRVTLSEVQPYPISTRPIGFRDYRVTVNVDLVNSK